MIDRKTIWDGIRIAGVLMLICALIAGLVALVNQLTYETIKQNLEAEKREAIIAIFGSESVTYEPIPSHPESVEVVYAVSQDSARLGYCVNLNADGFGGDINMMVGVAPDGKIVGVTIVSMSETPGLGSKVDTASYLSQYIGQRNDLVAGKDIDTISGATVSSKAVLAGVNAATEALVKMNLIGGKAA